MIWLLTVILFIALYKLGVVEKENRSLKYECNRLQGESLANRTHAPSFKRAEELLRANRPGVEL